MRAFGRVPIRSRWFRAWVTVSATGLLVATVLWATPLTGPSVPPTPPGSSAAAGSRGAEGSTGAGASPVQAWEPIVLGSDVRLADLVATNRDAAGVEPGTSFRLTSRTGASATDLASRLEVAPAIALRVAPGASASEAVVKPVAALAPGTTYRFRIRTDAGTVAASWLFRAKQPLHVVMTTPGDQATNVPVATGIEATFDQDGITGYTGRVTIEPAVAFELEVVGRSMAIVPKQALAERTLYTVTISRGIGVQGSDVTLERNVVFRFETGSRETSSVGVVALTDTFAEVSPTEVPVLRPSVACEQAGGTVDQDVLVYRLPSLDATIGAARSLASAPTWATWSDTGLVPTSGLPAVLRMTAHLDLDCAREGANLIALPSVLPPASYLVVLPHPGRDSQLLLQVTPLALYTSVSETRSLAWVNDTVTGRSVPEATVRVAGGSTLGRTGDDGLLVVETPAALRSATTSVMPVVVATRADGAAVVSVLEGTWSWMGADAPTERYWLALQTDRQVYRSNDAIRAWGVIRPRNGGAVAAVDVRLVSAEATEEVTAPALVRATATPDRAGAFSVSLPIADLPLGAYTVALVADGRIAATTSIQVDEIRKPAYRIDVTIDRHILVAGDKLKATARVAYFDGTPVPALDLAFEYGETRNATTDATGTASMAFTARSDENGDPTYGSITVTPVHPEEGTISGQSDVRVYRAAVWPTSETTARDGTLDLTGRLQVLDTAGLERAYGTDEPAAEGGAPVSGGSVEVSIVRIVQHQRETGRTYDWISKTTVPTYEGWTERVSVLSTTRRTDADGRFSLAVHLPDEAGQYETRVTAKDGAGRATQSTTYVDAGTVEGSRSWPWLTTSTGSDCCETYAVGDPVAIHVEQPVGAQVPGGDRYLFAVAQRGLREAVVRTTGSFERPFAAEDVPSLTLWAVEFTGRAYLPMDSRLVTVRQSTQQIAVDLSMDAATYRPGADARLSIRTTGPDGAPTSATVFVQAVDEKLYRIDGASSVDLLGRLYEAVPDGGLWSGATHAPPAQGGGRGDTTTGGGGDAARTDFRDTLLFRQVTTDASGRVTVPFTLSDDLTSWRVTAAAIDPALHAGTASIQVPVGLPFFVEATVAPEYLVADRPILRLRAYGSALKAGQAVRFTVAAPTLGLALTTVSGTAFQSSRLELPALVAGTHELRISGSTVGQTPAITDSLVRTVRVVASRYTELTTTVAPLDGAFQPAGGSGLTTYVVTDAGQATLVAILERLLWSDGPRVDQALGAAVARDTLVEQFDRDASALPATRFEAAAYQRYEGIALLPYAGVDPTLTTNIALAAPERFDRGSLRDALRASYGDPFSTQTREQGIIAVAGLAALGEPVGAEIDTFAAQPSLTVREQLYVAIAYAEAGDDASARAIERTLLSAYGRQMGPWVRLDVSPARDEIVEATGLLAILAAAIGDPVADSAQAYVEANPPKRTLQTLEELAFVRNSVDRLAPEAARFAYSVGGVRQVVDLAADRSFALTLTAAQRSSLRLEPLAGDLSVTTSWLTPARPGVSPADPDVRIVRTVSPGLSVGADQMVRVRLTVTFSAAANDQCYSITERVPSGLAPLPRPDPLAESDVDPTREAVIWPTAVTGQLVSFCASPVKPTVEAVYSARVVSPGTYTWEPATISASAGSGLVSLTATSTLTIR